ncbi:uncharacterized protein LOC144874991 [Branchiostoma floridae x Branchiostoma japonicum]
MKLIGVVICVLLLCSFQVGTARKTGKHDIRRETEDVKPGMKNLLTKLGEYAKQSGLLKREDEEIVDHVAKSDNLDEAKSSLMEFFLLGKFDKYFDKIARNS